MKLHWLSNSPLVKSGYGNQTALFVPRIKALGHDISITAFWGLEGSVLRWQDVIIYPRYGHQWGMDICAANAANFGAQVTISLIDAWVMDAQAIQRLGAKWAPWYPVDMEPLPPPVMRAVAQAYRRIVFSRFGERMTNDAGMDCIYVPHGVDTTVFHEIDRAEARKYLQWPDDKFVVGMVAANKGNPSRKAFAQQIEAFAMLHRRHRDTMLYLHTNKSERGELQGINLPELCAYFGLQIGADVLFCDPYAQITGFSDEYMANAYSGMDVHMLVSMGEGFGIPILEAQACGTPVIVGDWTAMSELCFGGWKVDKSEATKYWTPLAAYQYDPKPSAVYERLEDAYMFARSRKRREQARAGACFYDADLVAETYWRPALAEIEQSLAAWEPVEVLEAVAA